MGKRRGGFTDEQVEIMVSWLLRIGLACAATMVVIGGAIYLARHGAEQPRYEIFRGEPASLRSIVGILGFSLQGRGGGLIQLGLVLLMVTPVARVAFSVVAFARQRDWLYLLVTIVVLTILLFSLLARPV
jgi:uncharacterized membrane protein